MNDLADMPYCCLEAAVHCRTQHGGPPLHHEPTSRPPVGTRCDSLGASWQPCGLRQATIDGDQSQVVYQCRRSQEVVSRVTMGQRHLMTGQGDLLVQRRLLDWKLRLCPCHPLTQGGVQTDAAPCGQHAEFPDRDGREPTGVSCVVEYLSETRRQTSRTDEIPKPNMRIQQKGCHRRTSQSSSGSGASISSTSAAVPAIQPNPLAAGGGDGGAGSTCAIGTPCFVMRRGSPVLRTRANTARHVALNLEMEMVCI
jgi:hypothetical protein